MNSSLVVFQLALNLKPYVFSKLFLEQKSIPTLPLLLAMTLVAINPHMTIIQIHIGQNLVDDVLLSEGFGANIIIEDLRKQLGLPFPKPVPYML